MGTPPHPDLRPKGPHESSVADTFHSSRFGAAMGSKIRRADVEKLSRKLPGATSAGLTPRGRETAWLRDPPPTGLLVYPWAERLCPLGEVSQARAAHLNLKCIQS